VRIYWSHRQARTRRNIFRYRPAEAAVGVGVAGVVVGEDGEKEGMGKWMLTRVRKAVVDPLCDLLALFKALLPIGAKSANADATDQYTSCAFFLRALHSLYTPRFSTPVYCSYY
jgi:hypothetical protein